MTTHSLLPDEALRTPELRFVHLQEVDLLTVKSNVQASASSRKQQRSIRDFFASPPSVPLAKRFKAHSSALPDSALNPQSAAQPQQHMPQQVDQSASESPAHHSSRHEAAATASAELGGTHVHVPSCSGQHVASDQHKPTEAPPYNPFASQGALSKNADLQSTSSRLVRVAALSPSTSQIHSRKKVTSDAGSKLDLCGEVEMEDKENICQLSAVA